MLNISFNMGELTAPEAKALVVMLSSAFPEAGSPTRYTAKAVDVLAQSSAKKSVLATGDVDASAAFGQQVLDAEQGDADAASAFGGNDQTTATTSPIGDRDSAGIPWDERIHASTKTRTANGQWTRRRNTPDATYDAVMAELKGSTPAIPPVPAAPSVPAPPTAPTAQSPAPAAPAASSIDPASPTAFPEIMKKVTAAQAAGKIDPAGIGNLLASIGANPPTIIALNANKGLIPAFEALLADHVAMQG